MIFKGDELKARIFMPKKPKKSIDIGTKIFLSIFILSIIIAVLIKKIHSVIADTLLFLFGAIFLGAIWWNTLFWYVKTYDRLKKRKRRRGYYNDFLYYYVGLAGLMFIALCPIIIYFFFEEIVDTLGLPVNTKFVALVLFFFSSILLSD
jgi:magnesium-transporting ATPase (P-type)